MSNSKKPLAVLSMTAVAGLLAVAVTTPVSAAASAIAVNGTDAKLYEYSYADLKASAVAAVTNDTTGAKLYNDFLSRKASIKAYYDDVQKSYVDFSVVSAAAADAVVNQKTFNFNTFLQTATTETLTTVKTTVGTDGYIALDGVSTAPVTTLGISSVTATDAKTLQITFNKPVDNTDAIEEAGNRVVVYTSAKDATNPDSTSTVTTFSDDKKTATVVLGTAVATGQKYTVALVDNNTTPSLAKVVVASSSTELIKGLDIPTGTTTTDQDKFVVSFAKKMNPAAATAASYKVYDSNNVEVLSAVSAASFVDTTTKNQVKLTMGAGKLSAGKTYTVVVNNGTVLADDGTTLTAAQSKFTISTPSVATAKPVVTSAQVTNATTIVFNFDKDLKTNLTVDTDLIALKKADGTPITVSSAAISGKTLTITAPASSFADGKSYSVEIAASVAINDVYRNASSDAISKAVAAATNTAASTVTAQFVRETDDKTKFDLVLTFDQPVASIASATGGEIVINGLGKTYSLKSGAAVEAYTQDTTGKSLVIKDAGNASVFADATPAAFTPQAGKTYEVVAAATKITTNTPAGVPKTNTSDLKATVASIDVSAPAVKNVTLVSADKITVQFDETVNAAALTAGDISVKGFVKNLSGVNPSSTPVALTGANQIKYSVSGDTLTITPASGSVKFVTGQVGGGAVADTVKIAANKIKDANGIIDASGYDLASNDAKVIDLAAPAIVSAEADTDANTLKVVYSEDTVFKAIGSGATANAEASQFAVSGVKVSQNATAAGFANNVLTLTFTGSFESAKDYSAANLSYIKNTNYLVEDAADNQAATSTLTGLGDSF